MKDLNYLQFIANNIPPEDIDSDCVECGTPLLIKYETRDNGYREPIAYCNGCGITYS